MVIPITLGIIFFIVELGVFIRIPIFKYTGGYDITADKSTKIILLLFDQFGYYAIGSQNTTFTYQVLYKQKLHVRILMNLFFFAIRIFMMFCLTVLAGMDFWTAVFITYIYYICLNICETIPHNCSSIDKRKISFLVLLIYSA